MTDEHLAEALRIAREHPFVGNELVMRVTGREPRPDDVVLYPNSTQDCLLFEFNPRVLRADGAAYGVYELSE